MNSKIWTCSLLSAAVALGPGILRGQEASDAPPPPMMIVQAGGAEDAGGMGFGERIELLGFGGLHGAKVVKGAPFVATAVSESIQTLADGNRITRTTQSAIYRDSQGRFRKEVSLPGIGPLAASGQAHPVVLISDPVAGTSYVLEVNEKVARKMPEHMGMKGGMRNGAGGAPGYHQWKGNRNENAQVESLGTQTINGVSMEGTRHKRIIAAGEIGNEQPIEIVSERWYSLDLQMVVMSKHKDPRFGESTYKVTNIQRTEPDASLFRVPAGYTVQEGGPGRGMQHRFNGPPRDALPPSAN